MEDFDPWLSLAGLVVGLAGIGTIGFYTWINGKSRKKGLQAHWWVGLVLGTAGMALFFAGCGMLCFARPRLPIGWFRLAGLPVCIAGAALYSVGAWRVGRWQPPPRYHFDLHTGGIYNHLRHPQALALCILAIGLAGVSGSIPYLATLPIWLSFWTAYTYLEEKNELIPAFGEKYLRYRETTPRIIPRLPFIGKRSAGSAAAAPGEGEGLDGPEKDPGTLPGAPELS